MKVLPLLWIKNNRLNKSVLEQNLPTLRSIAVELASIENLLPPTDDHDDFVKNWLNAMREAVEDSEQRSGASIRPTLQPDSTPDREDRRKVDISAKRTTPRTKLGAPSGIAAGSRKLVAKAAAHTVDELGRNIFNAIKRGDQAAYLDTAIPEHAAEHYFSAYQSMVDNESDPAKKQKAIREFEPFKRRMRSHLRSLKGGFEKKWKTEIIGKAMALGIEWRDAELLDVITPGEKRVLPGIVRHADMIIVFRCRGRSFALLLDDPTKINGNWYFFDPPRSIRS